MTPLLRLSKLSHLFSAGICVALGHSSALAQSDGSLEETYARECPTHEDTQVCNALAKAMVAAAAPVLSTRADENKSPTRGAKNPWGSYAQLVGTVWRADQVYARYYWQIPGEVMLVDTVTSDQIAQNRISLTPENTLIVEPNDGRADPPSSVAFLQPGVAVQTFPDKNSVRVVYRFAKASIRITREDLKNGIWVPGKSDERLPTSLTDYEVARQTVSAAKEALFKRWGALSKLANSYWRGPDQIWSVKWEKYNELIRLIRYGLDGVQFEYADFSIGKSGEIKTESWDKSGTLQRSNSTLLPQGAVFYDFTDDAIVPRSADEFDWVNGRLVKGAFVRSDQQGIAPGKRANGVFRRMTNAEGAAFYSAWVERQKRLAAQREQGGNNGLLGALMMGAGAALGGGNAEVVMGAAMKGAELTTDNEMSRNVLAGQGDSMIASGVKRMTESSGVSKAGALVTHQTSTGVNAGTTGMGDPRGDQSSKVGATKTRFTFCIESRRANSEAGRNKEVVFYSRVGPITRRQDEYFRDTAGFSDFVDSQTDLPRSSVGSVCPHFDTLEAAEADLAMKRRIERTDVRPFIFVRDYIPE